MTDIANIIDAFQLINRGVQGVVYAPTLAQWPALLATARLPTVLTWYADDDWVKGGSTDFVIEAYVAPWDNADRARAMGSTLTLAQRFRETYRALGNVSGFAITTAKHNRSSGFGNDGVLEPIKFGDLQYFGFRMRVPLFSVS